MTNYVCMCASKITLLFGNHSFKPYVTFLEPLANSNFSYLILIGQFEFIFYTVLHTASFSREVYKLLINDLS